jgi:hypothetical protein
MGFWIFLTSPTVSRIRKRHHWAYRDSDFAENPVHPLALRILSPILSPIVDKSTLVFYSLQMIQVRETGTFSEWLSGLRDARAKAEVARRVRPAWRSAILAT